MKSPRLFAIMAIIVVAAAIRFIPHPPNFAPIGALALFGGTLFRSKKLALLIPVLAMLISDWMLGFHSLMLVVYGCFIFNVFLGQYWIGKDPRNSARIGVASILGSCVFFIVTNFACWLSFYEHDLTGLASCYAAALPFFRNTLLGDAVYTTVFFGALAWAEWRLPAVRRSSMTCNA